MKMEPKAKKAAPAPPKAEAKAKALKNLLQLQERPAEWGGGVCVEEGSTLNVKSKTLFLR